MTDHQSNNEESNTECEWVVDETTGDVYKLEREGVGDIWSASLSGLYLFFALGLFAWLLFAVWSRRFLPCNLTNSLPTGPTAKSFMYGFIGGGLGATSGEFYSFLFWHAKKRGFGWRFFWKSIFAPWIGATLALIVVALLHGGVGLLGAQFGDGHNSSQQVISMFGLGALAGFGTHDVTNWLDDLIGTVFKRRKKTSGMTKVPTLVNMTKDRALDTLNAASLVLGGASFQENPEKVGMVVSQSPAAGSAIAVGDSVNIVIGSLPPKVAPPKPAS
jgi:hypothetical protein